jgi:hypothetical protein
MKSILSSVQNFFGNGKNFGPLTFLLIILFLALLGGYSNGFNNIMDTMGTMRGDASGPAPKVSSTPAAAGPLGENNNYASVSNMKGTVCNTPDCAKKMVEDPSTLLPGDSNQGWATMNPSGQGSLQNVNLLNAGALQGEAMQSMRNPSLQLRSDPPIPRNNNVGPWNTSTIEPDTSRRSFDML